MENRLAFAPPMMEYVGVSPFGSVAVTVRTDVVPEATLAVSGEGIEGGLFPVPALGPSCTIEKTSWGTTPWLWSGLVVLEPPAARLAFSPNMTFKGGLSYEPSGDKLPGMPFAWAVGFA